jgi:hypothetical protein
MINTIENIDKLEDLHSLNLTENFIETVSGLSIIFNK